MFVFCIMASSKGSKKVYLDKICRVMGIGLPSFYHGNTMLVISDDKTRDNAQIKQNHSEKRPGGTAPRSRSCQIIVLGNEKGGSGKSTTAMHVAVALQRLGKRVGTIDLDARQGTLTRYLSNRFSYIARTLVDVPSPNHMAIENSKKNETEEKKFEESAFLDMAIHELGQISDFIVIDTPGSDTYLNRLAHQKANILITPMNDSFIDLDVLANVDPESFDIKGPSFYSDMVMDLQSRRRREGEKPIDWIVMRNRLSHLDANNKRQIGAVLGRLSQKYGFRISSGFGERVIFRELFLKGLTLMDLKASFDTKMTMSELAARQEVRHLVHAINPDIIANENRAAV